MASPVLSYIPEPHERPYYEALFAAADIQRTGNIGGAEAVQFLGLSKLPVEALKQVWTLADQNPTTNALDKRKFGIAVRLIQLQQNGQKAQGANLAAPPGVVLQPAMFEGVSGVSAPLPPAPAAAVAAQQPPPSPMRAPTPQQQPQQPPMRAATPTQPPMQQPMPMRAATPNQQQPMRAPPSPMSLGGAPPQPPQSSMALTTQDPYTMYPHDVSRYEALFPQYEVNKDGFVYGKEAVGLFSKSGLAQDQLRDIWNMVDNPVDNRLDKLEFAMAMHLIVCISKKNLPMPPALPYSLKIMKQAQQQPTSPLQEPALAPPSPVNQQPAIPSPGRPPLHPPAIGQPSPALAGIPAAVSSADSVGGGSMSSMPGPPQIVPQGGVSISDAFEGLSTTPTQSFESGPPPLPSMTQPQATGMSIPEPEPSGMSIPEPSGMSFPEPTMMARSEPMQAPVPAPAPPPAPPKDTKALAASYDMGDEHQELIKLKTTLQKLQAENISLKAQLGSMTEEEKEVQKEISATVAEIGKLSNELTGVRAKVLAAKSHLLEATADLNNQKEKKGAVTDLIDEAQSTRDALDAANAAIADINKAQAEPPAPAPSNFDADLFGWDAPAPAPAATTNDVTPAPQPEVHDAAPEVPQQADIPPPPPAVDPGSPGGFGGAPFGGTAGSFVDDAAPPAAPIPAPKPPSQPMAVAGVGSIPSSEEVDDLKNKLQEAESTANDAETQRRRLAEQADVLRRAAEQADQAAKQKDEAAHTTKKRGFGRGKKKELKEAEKLLQDAADKKRQFMEAQAAAQHASQVAMETKFEADKIRKQAEKAELEAVKNASMMDSQPNPGVGVPNTYSPAPPVEKKEAHNEFGNGNAMGGYGGSFGVMGGGGPSIPTPSADTANQDGWGGVMGGWGASGGDDTGGIPTPPQSAVGGDDPYANPF